MRIAIVSNLYPPYAVGGYEQGCRDIAEGLRRRNETVAVLTSNYGTTGYACADYVFRWLDYVPGGYGQLLTMTDALRHRDFILHNWRRTQAFLSKCQPQIIVFFQCTALPLPIIAGLNNMGYPVVYYLSDMWLRDFNTALLSADWYSFWERTPRRTTSKVLKRSVRSLANRAIPQEIGTSSSPLAPRAAIFTSRSIRDEYRSLGMVPARTQVIHWGVVPEEWQRTRAQVARDSSCVKLLYVGRVNERKGVHILLQAIAVLVNRLGARNFSLTIVGNCQDQRYQRSLNTIVDDANLEPYVSWRPAVPRTELPEIYAAHHVLIFPSIWKEPFSIALLEAMASSLAIVGTDRGGSSEILEDSKNALLYDADDPESLAGAIYLLFREPRMLDVLGAAARQTIVDRFTLATTVEAVDRFLSEIVEGTEA